jgi:hypothetical protein
VDATAWLSAMPASVVKAGDQDTAVREMLKGIPLPPGFDPSTIKTEGLTKNRYQLGASVVGTVACTWFQRWDRARHSGDRQGARAAIAAMHTARHWPILREMDKSGEYPEVLWAFADAMSSGRWYGRPLAGDVNSGLGCSGFGVHMSG